MIEQGQPDFDVEIAELAAMPPLAYDQVRKDAADRLGVRLGTLDQEILERRPKKDVAIESATAAAILAESEPWPSAVEGAAILAEVVAALKRFMILTSHEAATVALWVMFTHLHEAADNSPILCVKSPEKRCGKSTLLSIVATLVPRHLPTANVSPAALFRAIEKFSPTFLIDEGDTFLRAENEEMRGVLNSGFNRASAYVIRCDGDQNEPRPFKTWCAKLIALIGNLPSTLMDRSIVVLLRRRLAGEQIDRFARKHHSAMHDLRSKLTRWAVDNFQLIDGAEPQMPKGLNDRAEDCWRPLLAISDTAGGQWPDLARRAALALSGGTEDEDTASGGVLLLNHIRALFDAGSEVEIPSSRLAERLNENEEWPWGEWRAGKPITPRGVAKLLGRYAIKPRRSHLSNCYRRADFEDAWTRYATSPAGAAPSASSASSASGGLARNINAVEPDTSLSASSAGDSGAEFANRQKAQKAAPPELAEDGNRGVAERGDRNGRSDASTDAELY